MADPDRELLEEVLGAAPLMADLAVNEETFRAVVDAFRAQDGESMHRLLERRKLVDRCEYICHWLRSKEAVLLCLDLAGPPPREEVDLPDPREFAEVVAKLTADEETVELMAAAVQGRDTSAWSKLIERNGNERFSHLLCHWVCTVHYRLVCDVVCRPIEVRRPHLIPELQAAGAALSALAASEESFAAAVEAVRSNRCESLANTLDSGGFGSRCHLICEWFCSWRCMLACLRLCRIFPLEKIESDVGEMIEFARAGGRLAQDRTALQRLTAATLRDDVELVQSLVGELEFGPYCIQFCHWVCFLRCRLFCRCVCPPRTIGVFTKIGAIYYDTGAHSHLPGPGVITSGLTVSDDRAFYSTLRLNGGLSIVDGAPLVEYRFQTIQTAADGTPAGSWQPVGPSQIAPTNIGQFVRLTFTPLPTWETIEVWVNNPAAGVFNITPDGDGWIKVPPMFPVDPLGMGPGFRFVPGENLIRFDTRTLTPSLVSVDETGVNAGDSANAPLTTDVHYGVRMRMRDQGASGDGSDAGTCHHIAINNTDYDNISHHPYWPGALFGATNELAMASIGIAELASSPCSMLSNSMTVNFTAAHSHVGLVEVKMEGPGGPYPFTLPAPAPGDAGRNLHGTATPSGWTFAALPPCAYLLKLEVTVLLTTGDSVPAPPLTDYIAFCKGKARING